MKHVRWVALVAVSCALCAVLPGLARGQPSLLLDGNLKVGYQGLDGLVGVQSGQRVALEIVGKDIEGISGFSAQIVYDAAQLRFDGFDAGDAIPGFTGLKVTEGSGSVEVGGASVSGAAGVVQGRLGVVYFVASNGFSGGASVSIDAGTLSTGASSSPVSGQSQVTVGIAIPGQVILDADVAPGLQAARNILDVAAGDVIAIEIYGRDIAGVSGFSATLEYDAAQLAFAGFSATELIPGLTGLQVESAGSVEIGGASVEGAAPVAEGRLGVLQFVLQPGYTGSATVQLAGGRVSVGGASSDFQSTQVISVGQVGGEAPDDTVGPMALDLDTAPGDQGKRQISSPGVGNAFEIDLVATSGASGLAGYQAELEFDPALVSFSNFAVTGLFDGAIPITTPKTGSVTISVAFLGGGPTRADAGSIGRATFRVVGDGVATVKLASGVFSTSSEQTPLSIGGGGATATIGGEALDVKTPDLDGSGKVDFPDFLVFAGGFGKAQGEAGFDARMDYDDSGKIDFPDFLFFAQNFGKTVGN